MSAGAAVYTTSRGKNKKHKAKNDSKKASANSATRLNTALSASAKELLACPEEKKPRLAGLGSVSFKAKLAREVELRTRAAARCSNPACPSEVAASGAATAQKSLERLPKSFADLDGNPTLVNVPARAPLQRCACTLASYCGAECQRAHWGVHKAPCKEKRADMVAVEAASARAAAELVAEAEKSGAGGAGGGGGGSGVVTSSRKGAPPFAPANAETAKEVPVVDEDEEEEEESES